MDRSDVEMKKGLVQGGGPDGDSICGGLALSSRSFSKPAADPERPSDSRKKWAVAISDVVTAARTDSTGRIRRGNLDAMIRKARNWGDSE